MLLRSSSNIWPSADNREKEKVRERKTKKEKLLLFFAISYPEVAKAIFLGVFYAEHLSQERKRQRNSGHYLLNKSICTFCQNFDDAGFIELWFYIN